MSKNKHINSILSLSPAQQGMLYESIHMPTTGIHIEQLVCTLTGQLDCEAFEQAWQWVIQRHDMLRTCFVWEKQTEPLQVVLQQVTPTWVIQDWRMFSLEEQEAQIAMYLQQDRKQGFKLAKVPLLRFALFQTDNDVHEFVWTYHHILMDGWCSHLVFREVFSCYLSYQQHQPITLAPARPYKDYIHWLKRQDLAKAEQFWRQELQHFTTPTAIGREEPSPSNEEISDEIAIQSISLSASTTEMLQTLARKRRLTPNTLFQGIWALLLRCYSQNAEVMFGITVSGRPPEIAGSETIVGLCINTLPLRVSVNDVDTLWNWLDDLQKKSMDIRQYEYCSSGLIHQWSGFRGNEPLYESVLVVENYPVDLSILQQPALNIRISNIRSHGAHTRYPLTILVVPGSRTEIICRFLPTRFAKTEITKILHHIQSGVEALLQATEQTQAGDLIQSITPEQIPVIRPRKRMHLPATEHSERNLQQSQLEEILSAIWMDILGVDSVHPHENFFEAGGHSLLATQFIARIRTHFQIELPLRSLFEMPTIKGIAKMILQLSGSEQCQRPSITAVDRTKVLPLSFAQQRLWFLHQLIPNNTSYTITRPLRIRGILHIDYVQRSIAEIIRRHEVLRTVFRADLQAVRQVILPPFQPPITLIDLQNVDETEREQMIIDLIQQQAQSPFDLENGPLLRITILRVHPDEHILLLTIHHIAFDAWSEGIFMRELSLHYRAFCSGEQSVLPELPIQYADFSFWQRSWLTSDIQKQTDYWRKQLSGATPLQLPIDQKQQETNLHHGAMFTFTLPTDLLQRIKRLCRQEGVTLFMTLLAAFQVLLYRYNGQEDITIGTDIANRTMQETEDLIGFFVNLLALRIHLNENLSFTALLQRVRTLVLEAYAHQDMPFEQLVDVLHLQRSGTQVPLINTLFVLQNTPTMPLMLTNATVEPIELDLHIANFDLALFLWEEQERISGMVNYRAQLFHAETIQKIIKQYQALLVSIVLAPETRLAQLELRTEAEQRENQLRKQEHQDQIKQKLKGARREKIAVPSQVDDIP